MERILIVDDDMDICKMLRRNLMFEGRYDVFLAHDGETAVKKVKGLKPHIVLLDIKMPGMGGIEVLKKIKKAYPEAGVIMITGTEDEELARKALSLGAYEYLVKPFSIDYLKDVIMVKIVDMLGRAFCR